MPSVKGNELFTAARVLEYCETGVPWNRRLWAVSPHLQLHEILEAAQYVQEGVLSEAAIVYLQSSFSELFGADPGLGDAVLRDELRKIVRGDAVRFKDLRWFQIKATLQASETHYLDRWAKTLETGTSEDQIERTARSIASYLLDIGFGQEFLAIWIRNRVFDTSRETTLSDLLRELAAMSRVSPSEHEGIIPLASAPNSRQTQSANWMDASLAVEWLKRHRFGTTDLRLVGAIRLQIKARDAFAASKQMIAVADRLTARITLGSRGPFQPPEFLFVKGISTPIALGQARRGVAVLSIGREDRLYDVDLQESAVDHATNLLAVLDAGAPGAAVASGWAAVESLLMAGTEKGDLARAADRMAAIAACSFARAELTKLSYAHRCETDELGLAIRSAATNRERSGAVVSQLRKGALLDIKKIEDVAAMSRMRALVASPTTVLRKVQRYVTASLRRFYRQRNIVLHGGRLDSCALDASLRTAAPLIGAGIDRIHHAFQREGLDAIALAARAQLHLATMESDHAREVYDLLEP